MIKETMKGALNGLGYEIKKKKTFEPPAWQPTQTKKETRTIVSDQGREEDSKSISLPLMIDDKTYFTDHPDYNADVVRNYPGEFYSVHRETARTASSRSNPLFQRLVLEKNIFKPENGAHLYQFIRPQINACAEELKDDPHFVNFTEKVNELERIITEMNENYPGRYHHGGVSIEKAKFLYWLVRTVKPKTVVQTGTSNGVSCAYIAMALAKNGNGGRLHAVDLPAIFNPEEKDWVEHRLYGVVIPKGKKSAWLVPDGLSSIVTVEVGDAKKVLPEVLKKAGDLDLFYHDSDHTYNHMYFEFSEALPYLKSGSLILADDIAWSTVTWDFAQEIGCYALNHEGSQGLIFL